MSVEIWRAGTALGVIASSALGQVTGPNGHFPWPEGKEAAVSLSFDDGRTSQVDAGLDLSERFGAKVTFYVTPSSVERRLEGWKRAAAAGHEIANHSLTHPCSGNFQWSRGKALEDYTMDMMRTELVEANRQIEALLGIRPTTFAYPCGQTFVGRGVKTQSYVPLVAELFTAGRGWLDEAPNDPAYCDMAQLYGMELDGKSWEQAKALIEGARKGGLWLVFAGHEIGASGNQTTRIDMLEKLLAYVQDPANGIWLAPISTVAEYVIENR
jgi:peptidoglycan/xylan/chitin deacetylase (PgdA/CDA1 family)